MVDETSAPRSSKLLTLPNLVTLVRLALVPVFVIAALGHQHATAMLVFISAAATDALDGWVARRFNLRSRLGAILDPAADKLLMVSGYVVYTIGTAAEHRLPDWLTFTVFARDLLIVLFAYLLYTRIKIRRFPPSIPGKLSTLTQVLALAATIAANTALEPAMRPLLPYIHRLALVMTMYSGADYVRRWERVLNGEA